MNDDELQALTERLSLDFFEKPFRHRACFNGRLRTTGGRYMLQSHNIELNVKHYNQFGPDELVRIIKHELCHYHLHLEGKGYRHRDRDFKRLLEQVGGSRHCRAVGRKRRPEPYRYCLTCTACQQRYYRKRKMNVNRYVCGRCQGKLTLSVLEQ